MFQPCQHNLLARLLNLAGQKYFIEYRINLCHHQSADFSPPYPTSLTPPPYRFLTPAFTQTHLVEVKHQIQLTNIPKERIQHLDEKMYRLQIR